MKREEEALFHYKKAVEFNDGSALPPYNLGNFYLKLNRLEEAIAQYVSALNLNPRYPSAMGNMGNALLRLGRYGKAAQMYRRALAIAPNNAVATRGLEIAEKAITDETSGNGDARSDP